MQPFICIISIISQPTALEGSPHSHLQCRNRLREIKHLATVQQQEDGRAGWKEAGGNQRADWKWMETSVSGHSGMAALNQANNNWIPKTDFPSMISFPPLFIKHLLFTLYFFITLRKGLSHRARSSHVLHRISNLEATREQLGKLLSKKQPPV